MEKGKLFLLLNLQAVLKVSQIYSPRIKDVNLKLMEWIKGLECDGLGIETQFYIIPKLMLYIKMNRTENSEFGAPPFPGW